MILAHDIETRTSLLRIQVPVPYDDGVGISPMKLFQQSAQGDTLSIRPSVHWLSVRRQPADVADSNRMAVMMPAMCSDHLFRSAGLDRPIRWNDIVIPAAYPAERTMVTVNVCHSEGTARPVGGAVHNNQSYGSHRLLPSAPPAAPVISSSTSFTM